MAPFYSKYLIARWLTTGGKPVKTEPAAKPRTLWAWD